MGKFKKNFYLKVGNPWTTFQARPPIRWMTSNTVRNDAPMKRPMLPPTADSRLAMS